MGLFNLIIVILVPVGVYVVAKKYTYYVKMGLFFTYCGMITAVALPFLFLRPRDYRNALIPAAVARYLTKLLLNVSMECRGLENLKVDKGCVMVINHQSALDLLVLGYVWPLIGNATVTAKVEVFYLPIFGLASYLWGTLFINRKNRARSVEALSKESKAINQRNAKLLIFPEGSRNDKDTLLPFKKGAFHIALDSKCPIQPVVVSKYYFLDSNEKRFDRGHTLITFLPEISTETYSKDTIQDLVDVCRDRMQEEFTKLSREAVELEKCGKFG